MNRLQRGFTIIEMIVVIFIIAILAGFAAPAMNGMIRAQKVRSIAYDIVADLTYARGEAIARGHAVAMQSASGNNWLNGWQIVDLGANPIEVLRTEGPRSPAIKFTADAGSIQFDRTGRITNANSASAFYIEPVENAPDHQKRCIKLAPSGRPSTTNPKFGVCQ